MIATLEERQVATTRAVHALREARGYPPTIREIVKRMGLSSTSVASRWVREAVAAGYLDHDPERARTLRVTDAGLAAIEAQP